LRVIPGGAPEDLDADHGLLGAAILPFQPALDEVAEKLRNPLRAGEYGTLQDLFQGVSDFFRARPPVLLRQSGWCKCRHPPLLSL
jgi:hypothetical protein